MAKVTNDPLDYRYYIDDAVLAKIKELINRESIPRAYTNLLSSVKVGQDQTTQRTIEQTKQEINEQATTANTSIDFKRALDILRFNNDQNNPYYPKGELATPEAIEDFKLQYQTAQDIMTKHVGTDPNKIADLPSRVVVAQKDFLLNGIKQARQESVKAETEKLQSIKNNTVELQSRFESAKSNLAYLRSLDPNSMTIDQQQAHQQNLAQAQQAVTDLRTEIYKNLAESKTTRENIKEAENQVSKTDKQFDKSLSKAKRNINKEERTTLKQFVKNLKDKATEKFEDYKTQKAFDDILGKQEKEPEQGQVTAPNSKQTENNEQTAESQGERPVVLTPEQTAAKEAAQKAEFEQADAELLAQLQSGAITHDQYTEQQVALAVKYGKELEPATEVEEQNLEQPNAVVEAQTNPSTPVDDLQNRLINEMNLSPEAAAAAANAAMAVEAAKAQAAAAPQPQEVATPIQES